jgi:pyruvate dehydrogenase E1 component alpha subunit
MDFEKLLETGDLLSTSALDLDLDLQNFSPSDALAQLYKMYRIRKAETKIAEMRRLGTIGGPVHLGAGQEAIAVGISKYLRKSDRVFSAHRSHAHLLALGTDPYRLFAEILGRATGLTKGMGGSMHLLDKANGFYGSVPIVAGTVPLAVGAGLAAKIQKSGDIAVAYFGDGAAEEGVVQESLNLASQLKVPVLFVCENNLFSSHMHISQRQPKNSVARFAQANFIPYEVIDGNNIVSVEKAASELIGLSRRSGTPVFIEAITYRHFGHVDWREDIDVGVNRSANDLKIWKSRDPIERLEKAILKLEVASLSNITAEYTNISNEIDSCWDQAISDEFPPAAQLMETVYSGVKS